MTDEGRKLRIVLLRREIAFLHGDSRIGGPSHTKEIEELNRQIRELENERDDSAR